MTVVDPTYSTPLVRKITLRGTDRYGSTFTCMLESEAVEDLLGTGQFEVYRIWEFKWTNGEVRNYREIYNIHKQAS